MRAVPPRGIAWALPQVDGELAFSRPEVRNVQPAERVSTGIQGLDGMLGGGVFRGSVTLIKGAPGTGKTGFGLCFIAEGASKAGEPGLVITFEQFPVKMARDARSIGIDLPGLEKRGLVKVVFTSPEIFYREAQKAGGILDALVHETGARRILVDSISHLERVTRDPIALREISYAFINSLLRHELTAFVTQEDVEITGEVSAAQHGISYLVDTVILLRYVELDSSIRRALLVLKQRASDHDKSIREYVISSEGIRVGEPFADREGILSGTPIRRELEAFMEVFGKKSRSGD
jgi:circadian clock protein KaiC